MKRELDAGILLRLEHFIIFLIKPKKNNNNNI